MSDLGKHIEILLLENDCVIVPGFGGFIAHYIPAHQDESDGLYIPPKRTLGFNQQLKMNDSLLAQSYVEAYDMSFPEALHRIEVEVKELCNLLRDSGEIELSGLGILYHIGNDVYEFVPGESGLLTPSLYGLNIVEPIKVVLSDEPQHSLTRINTSVSIPGDSLQSGSSSSIHADSNKLRTSVVWLRNFAAACVALIAYILFPAPLDVQQTGNVSMQSAIDLKLLQQIVSDVHIKTITAAPKSSAVKTSGAPSVTPTKKNLPQTKISQQDSQNISNKAITVKSAEKTSFYSLVLASKVTRKNAEDFVARIKKMNYPEAQVWRTANHIKVIYGKYPSEAVARDMLNKLKSNSLFRDAWVFHAVK